MPRLIRRFAASIFCFALLGGTAAAAMFVVDSAGDESDDDLTDGICHTSAGSCTLRAAIEQANAAAGADTINFNIPGSGVHTILPALDLPTLTDDAGVTIDGFTQPGASPNTLPIGSDAAIRIELQGTGSFGAQAGLNVVGNGATIRGLAINRFRGLGIVISAGYGHRIIGCFIGTDPTGTAARPNGFGLSLYFASAAPTAANLPATAVIGGPEPGDRNVISGNNQGGIYGLSAVSCVFLNNYIGVDASGIVALPNQGHGLQCLGCSLTIGQDSPFLPGAHTVNVVSGNGGSGIVLGYGVLSRIVGNFIGTDASGSVAIPNASGVGFVLEAAAIVEDNLISGNFQGAVSLSQTSVSSFLFNRIGTDLSGTSGLGNGGGISVLGQSVRNVFVRNTVAFNAGTAVVIGANAQALANENSISANSIHDNVHLGIDLGWDGVTPNNDCDPGRGPNLGQNYPVLTSITPSATSTTIDGTLNSVPNTTFSIEFFSNTACNYPGYGQGQTFIGATSVTTDASCNTSFSVTLPIPVAAGQYVTATATDPAGNFSEFCACVIADSALVVTSALPTSGPSAGVADVAVSGSNFAPGASVTVGGVPAGNVVYDRASRITLDIPPLSPGALYPIAVTNPGGPTATLLDGWFADFLDVPATHPFHGFVERIARRHAAFGCGGGNYCPADPVSRAQAAVFLLRSNDGPSYTPPPCSTPTFADVPCSSPFAPWVDELAARNVTAGCGGSNFCPSAPVTRAQVAVLLLRTKLGASYAPPACVAQFFSDVPCYSPFAPWVNDLSRRGFTAGCGGGNYCPDNPVTRGQAAVLLSSTFALP